MPHQRLRLVSFLLVSGVAHALALGMWGQERVALTERALGEPIVTVVLPPVVAQSHETKMKERTISKKALNSRQMPRETARKKSPGEPEDAAAPTRTDNAQRRRAQNALLGEIRTRLSQHFTYPPFARYRGWQGEVLLGFAIDLDGRLSHIRVARSSGYDILDKSALDSLQKVEQLALEEFFLDAPIYDLRLPVIYRLTEN